MLSGRAISFLHNFFIILQRPKNCFPNDVGAKGLRPDQLNLILPNEKENFYNIDKFF